MSEMCISYIFGDIDLSVDLSYWSLRSLFLLTFVILHQVSRSASKGFFILLNNLFTPATHLFR